MKFKFLLFSFAFIVQSLAQENWQLLITDEKNVPISDVAVFTADNAYFGVSNAVGKISFEAVTNNPVFTFQHPSYLLQNIDYNTLANQNFKVTLAEKTIILDEMVISVTKTVQSADAISNKVDVIKQKEIEFLNPQTSADMLLATGNVYVQKSQAGGGSPILRGFEANKVLLVVDGVRMNNAIYRGGHLQNVITIDEAMLERSEVVFGPGSLIYGSDALGGVMHFYTRDPKLAYNDTSLNVFGNASVRYSSVNQEKTAHFDLNVGGKKWASLTSFSFSEFDDLKAGSNRNPAYGDYGLVPDYVISNPGNDSIAINNKPYLQRGTGYKQYDVLQKIVFQPKDDLRIKLNLQFSTSNDIPRYDKLRETRGTEVTVNNGIQVYNDTVISIDSTYEEDRLRWAEWYYGPQTRLLAALSFQHTKKNKLYEYANYTLSYQYIQESRHSRAFNDPILESNYEKLDVFTFNADFKKTISPINYVIYGFESNLNTVQSYGEGKNLLTDSLFSIQSRYPEEGSFLVTNALYAKHSIDIAKKVTFSQGIRFNQIYLQSKFSDRVFSGTTFNDVVINPLAVSFSFDFTFRPGKAWQVNTLFSSGYRAPNVDDVGKVFDPNPQEIVIPNANLKPEYAYNFEAGLSKSINDKAKIEAVGYFTILSNVINRAPISLNGSDSVFVDGGIEKSQVMANVNEGYGYIAGTSINLKANLARGLDLNSSFNYTYGILKDDNSPMAHIPPIYGRTSLNYRYNNWQTSVWSQYQGWKRVQNYSNSSVDNLNEATAFGTPPWFTLNWTNAYNIKDVVTISFAIENILDKHYRPFGSGVSAGGRNFTVGLRGSF